MSKQLTPKRAEGCVDVVCRPYLKHSACYWCGRLCDGTTIRVNPTTLRRQKTYICSDCTGVGDSHTQEDARERRTRRDWLLATDPIDSSAIRGGVMPEQIPSEVRRALRAFYDSTDATAVVIGPSTTTLNQSIESLGLQHEMYAEERSTQVVLRKVRTARRPKS